LEVGRKIYQSVPYSIVEACSLSFMNFKLFEECLDKTSNNNKQPIYLYIKDNPGVHLRRISKSLNFAIGDTNYNLNSLEQSGFIKYRKWGVFKRYFIVSIRKEVKMTPAGPTSRRSD
jgi:predicted transcriptional regulator